MMWERELYFYFSWNIMERGLGPGGMHIATSVGLGQWVGYLMGPHPGKLVNFNFLNTAMNVFYLTLRLMR